ncbi:MAG: Transcriptional regulator, XRE family [Candidatus Woesebacteria bacterium GW2011_GWB1_38_5b]|uniref:Transcriptional regulator, XRE family n=1 Tax=Candidatus Woesebacteria bacterium GW2011_GWB1_38_5b TaxID=1618569 RepID=A0A0G0K4J7_9BACT|nr:MAG: Transcriptional regulator, XRE family [Candidatus Woesebacteria bacterium GW2011_GWB1_38_5b]
MITERDKKLGKKIKKLRKLAKFTQEELAEKMKVSPKYIQFIENGSRKPSLKTVYKIAKVLGVKVQELFPF